MLLSLCTKVMQQMQHFCTKKLACNDTLGAKRYKYPKSTNGLKFNYNMKSQTKCYQYNREL